MAEYRGGRAVSKLPEYDFTKKRGITENSSIDVTEEDAAKRCPLDHSMATRSALVYNTMEKTWILIANAERAHCYVRHEPDHALSRLIDFEHPHNPRPTEAGQGDPTGAAGKGHGRTGHAGTQFEPHTEAHAKERALFARQIADYINAGVAAKQYSSLVLIATSPMLGELRSLLSPTSMQRVRSSISSDLTHYEGPELKRRIDEALQLPE